jgi:hypothetical protein
VQLLLTTVATAADKDETWTDEFVDQLIGGKAVAAYVVAAIAALYYFVIRDRGLHITVTASIATLPVDGTWGSLSIVVVDVVNRDKHELPLVQCQVVRRGTPDDHVVLPKWTEVDGVTVAAGKWPKPPLKRDHDVTVRMAFDPATLNGLEQAKVQVGPRFRPRYADIAGGPPRAHPGGIETG